MEGIGICCTLGFFKELNKYFEEAELDTADGVLMRVYDGIKHTDVAEEFILPDYLPDVKRIIRVDIKPKIDGKYITSGKRKNDKHDNLERIGFYQQSQSGTEPRT